MGHIFGVLLVVFANLASCLDNLGMGHVVQFSLVTQSCPTLQPHELQQARPPCPSPTPGVHSNSCPLSQTYYWEALFSLFFPLCSFFDTPLSRLFWGEGAVILNSRALSSWALKYIFLLPHFTLAFAWFSCLSCCFLLSWLQLEPSNDTGSARIWGAYIFLYPLKELDIHLFSCVKTEKYKLL